MSAELGTPNEMALGAVEHMQVRTRSAKVARRVIVQDNLANDLGHGAHDSTITYTVDDLAPGEPRGQGIQGV